MEIDPSEQNTQSFYERIILNNHKGEIYRMKLKSSPLVFSAIPVQHEGMSGSDKNLFSCKIIEPDEYKGNYKGLIEDIDFMDKLTG